MIDVGAGYGRLAHRLATVLPDAEVYCTDGIAVSTAICDADIRYRGLADRVTVVPLTRLDSIPTPIRVASNVRSFSEMSYEAVAWWLDWLVDGRRPLVRGSPHRSRLRAVEDAAQVRRPARRPLRALSRRLLPVPPGLSAAARRVRRAPAAGGRPRAAPPRAGPRSG